MNMYFYPWAWIWISFYLIRDAFVYLLIGLNSMEAWIELY